MSLTAVRTDDGFSVTGIGAGTDYSISDVVLLTILPKSDWENYTGEMVGELGSGEIALAASSAYEKGTLALDNETYQVKQIYAYPETDHDYLDDMADDSVFMIVPDREALGQIFTELKQNWDEERVSLQIKYNMAFDIDGTAEEKKWQRKIRFMRRLPHTMTGIRRMMQRTLILERMSNAGRRTGMNTTA